MTLHEVGLEIFQCEAKWMALELIIHINVFTFRYNEKFTQQCQGKGNNLNGNCNEFTEGCFCPEGMTLFNSSSYTCVSSCKKAFCCLLKNNIV